MTGRKETHQECNNLTVQQHTSSYPVNQQMMVIQSPANGEFSQPNSSNQNSLSLPVTNITTEKKIEYFYDSQRDILNTKKIDIRRRAH